MSRCTSLQIPVPGAEALAIQLRTTGRFAVNAVVVVGVNVDGLAAMSDALAGRTDVSAIHVVTHGAPGRLLLGDHWIDLNAVKNHSDEVAAWAQSLAPGADLLVYGCDVGAGPTGRSLEQMFVTLTGADVAESIDRTGSARLSGDWYLELPTGRIDTPVNPRGGWDGILATATVDNTNDSGPGSLRQAILDANAGAGIDSIVFAIPGFGTHVNQPITPLHDITGQTVLDGSTQPGFTGTRLIEIDGSLAGVGMSGLTLAAGSDGSTIRGLAVVNFSGPGLELTGSGGHTIAGDWIGTNDLGATGLGNGAFGIELNGSSGNTIGGPTVADRNFIVGNLGVVRLTRRRHAARRYSRRNCTAVGRLQCGTRRSALLPRRLATGSFGRIRR